MTGFQIEATARMISERKLTNLLADHAAFWRFVTVCKWDRPKLENKKSMNQNIEIIKKNTLKSKQNHS